MGQFYSREFDGDPYIDLMRSLPERELVWWAQKVIWLAEGFTFVDHFARTYPRLFQHKCSRCKGAGVMTCPACAGTKVPLGQAEAQRRPALATIGAVPGAVTDLGRAAGVGGSGECRVCGHGCAWDAESEWMERWNEWESRLAFYDKATGPLMDEWYEDVINAGNLEEDTQPAEDEPPGPEAKGAWADDDRQIAKSKKRMEALMKRFGHPYDSNATLGYQIVDPTASMGENIWNMAQVYNSLPTELQPQRTAAHLAPRAGDQKGASVAVDPAHPAVATVAAAEALDREIMMEAAVMQNLQAAAQDLPKPHRFRATAGTVPCDECGGEAWSYSFFPNTQRLFGLERPLWADTVARLEKYWSPTHRADPDRTGQLLPYGEHGLRSMLEAAQEDDHLAAIAGPKPETTERYRRDLELLAAVPQLRDARLRVPAGLDTLSRYLEAGIADGDGGRDIAAVATPLELPAAAGSVAKRRQRQQEQGEAGALVPSRS